MCGEYWVDIENKEYGSWEEEMTGASWREAQSNQRSMSMKRKD